MTISRLFRLSAGLSLVVTLGAFAAGCRPASSATPAAWPAPCALALAPQPERREGGRLSAEISRLQEKVRSARAASRPLAPELERLGWKFVEQARATYDAGYYKLAEACALCAETRPGGAAQGTALEGEASAGALLLRGHALHNLHRFKEAEAVARRLASSRGLPFDFALLGDVLMEQGKLAEAVAAYQRMMNLKPNLQAYARAAHVRWLEGDLPGAVKLAEMAVAAGSPAEGEATAWAATRLALYQLQGGRLDAAARAVAVALDYKNDYAPALLARGRVLLAEGKAGEAVSSLSRAAQLNPLPEYQWALADALGAPGKADEARRVEERLVKEGRTSDPRTLALFLATPRAGGPPPDAETALRLAAQETEVRSDVFTLDALAWAQAAAGKYSEAQATMRRALAAGTEDARLFYHAGVIAARSGRRAEAERQMKKAYRIRHTLLPSERADLEACLTAAGRPAR
jgi:tetratricopeptide (TPR) repeat protein